MNAALQQALEALDQEIEAIDQQRADLLGAREHLAKVAGNTGVPAGTRQAQASRTKTTRKTTPRTPDLPDADDAAAILKAIKAGAETVSAICAATKFSAYIVKTRLTSLQKARHVVITGSGRGQRVGLKEAL